MRSSAIEIAMSELCANLCLSSTEFGSQYPIYTQAALRKEGVILKATYRTKIDKVNAELVTLTYGTIVAQLCQDYDGDYLEVNKQLDKMGYNIGMRLIEDFLAKSNTGRCANFKETADIISKVRTIHCSWNMLKHARMERGELTWFVQVGFKIFLNITPTVTNWTSDNKQFSLVLDENPLADFVELPDDDRAQDQLWFSNILCGVLRGALEMVRYLLGR